MARLLVRSCSSARSSRVDHARLVHDERSGAIGAAFVTLLALEDIDVLEALMTMRRDLGSGRVTKHRNPGTVS